MKTKKGTKRGPYKTNKVKKDLFEIRTDISFGKNKVNNAVLKTAINTILNLRPGTKDAFIIPNNKENGAKPQSLPQILRNRLQEINKNIKIYTGMVGSTTNPTGVKIKRIN